MAEAEVDGDGLAGDAGVRRRGERDDERGDVLRRGEAVEAGLPGHIGDRVVGEHRARHRRVDHRRQDAIDEDPARREVD
jgi:hypothetical protein